MIAIQWTGNVLHNAAPDARCPTRTPSDGQDDAEAGDRRGATRVSVQLPRLACRVHRGAAGSLQRTQAERQPRRRRKATQNRRLGGKPQTYARRPLQQVASDTVLRCVSIATRQDTPPDRLHHRVWRSVAKRVRMSVWTARTGWSRAASSDPVAASRPPHPLQRPPHMFAAEARTGLRQPIPGPKGYRRASTLTLTTSTPWYLRCRTDVA